MDKETKLVKKVKRLLRRLGCPRWLHHFGPKKYEFYQHLCALLIMHYCSLSYRRTVKLLNLLGLTCASKSALQYTAKRIQKWIWDCALQITAGIKHHIIALDSTGFSRTHPSYYYLQRIDGKMPKVPVKVSIAYDTKKKKYCAAKIRILPAHDIKDAKSLLKLSKPKVLVADKAYDANWLHIFCSKNKIKAHIPIRNKGKPKHENFSARRKAALNFRLRTYHRRELGESGNSGFKRKFGASVSSKKARTIRTEVYGRLACHNIFSWFEEDLGQSLFIQIIYKCKLHNSNYARIQENHNYKISVCSQKRD